MRFFGKMIVFISVASIFSMSFTVLAQESGDAKSFVIAGAGPSIKVVELLAQEFSAVHEGYKIIVPPKSIKHKGGLEWVTKSDRLFGRTGRPLSEQDKKTFPAVVELPIAGVKTAFAVSKGLGVTELTLEQWTNIYKGTVRNWKLVGGPDKPIILLGRAKGESVHTAITNVYPFFGEAKFPKIYDKEHQMVKAIRKIPGAIGFSSKSVLAADEELIVLNIEDFNAGLRVALVYNKKNEGAEIVQMMKAFIRSDRWRKALEAHDFLPVNTE